MTADRQLTGQNDEIFQPKPRTGRKSEKGAEQELEARGFFGSCGKGASDSCQTQFMLKMATERFPQCPHARETNGQTLMTFCFLAINNLCILHRHMQNGKWKCIHCIRIYLFSRNETDKKYISATPKKLTAIDGCDLIYWHCLAAGENREGQPQHRLMGGR